MREENGRKYVDKQFVARRLINAAIRNCFAGECAITNQVIIGSALTLMKEHAEAQGIKPRFDLNDVAKPEFAKGMSEALKSFYNFFKHANHDHHLSIDVTNLSAFNDVSLLQAVIEYSHLYGSMTRHMQIFNGVQMILHPKTYQLDEIKKRSPQLVEGLEYFANMTRDEVFDLLADMDLADIEKEAVEDTAPLLNEGEKGFYSGPPHRDMFKIPAK